MEVEFYRDGCVVSLDRYCCGIAEACGLIAKDVSESGFDYAIASDKGLTYVVCGDCSFEVVPVD